MAEYFGGTSEIWVPDQLKSGVTRSCRYEPGVNRSYQELAHYGAVVVPARPGKARDQAKVEPPVLVAQRWILARLRHRSFFALEELNAAIGELLEDLNSRPLQKLGVSRRELWEPLNRPALRPLPPARYALAQWTPCRVNIDYSRAWVLCGVRAAGRSWMRWKPRSGAPENARSWTIQPPIACIQVRGK